MAKRHFPAALAFIALGLFSGCENRETATPEPKTEPAVRQESRIIIPEQVQGQWKAVKVAVLDKANNREEVFTITLGEEKNIPNSGISVQAQNFMPAFIMHGTTLTSVSNEPKNPAVQIIVREDGEEIFKGWLFSLYPGTHAFQHPRYSFSLIDYIPAEKG